MIYGYARVSSIGQEQNGNSLQDQREKLEAAGAQIIYSDTFTGKTMQRPEFEKLKAALCPGDTLICTKLDRFSRSVKEGAEVIDELLKRGVTINIMNVGVINDTPTGQLMITMLMAFAEFERSQIVERTQAGRRIAIENGQQMGRPQKYGKEQMQHALELLDAGHSYKQVESMTGISKRTLIRHRNAV